ncbi:hepatocyte growth factor activator serine proteases-like [Saccoglossus kowalevskii]|uniref:Neurogenic locus notch homolog protein 2-like n=1 Tax=Saccoglossus kowalevskii TaxID=10224 RepID=A0ABM0MNF8_SACKO|nr:PREDICTED: neurogenic locus notch homolog protein 2-like [Saccoglossus kowalevskii]
MDRCLSDPCLNDGTCVNSVGQNKYICYCKEEYSGDNCEVKLTEAVCFINQCVNGGTCIDNIDQFSCLCPDGYTGAICEVNINECESSPCLNGGTCLENVNTAGYVCQCPANNMGYNCQGCMYIHFFDHV